MDQSYADPSQTPSSVFQVRDTAKLWPGAPPNWGQEVVPGIFTVSGSVGLAGRAYLNADEAMRHDPTNAARMRVDCGIMECLEARQRATALLNWHLEPEDSKDAGQKDLVTQMTTVIERSPFFMEFRHSLMQATWYGRYAMQLSSHQSASGLRASFSRSALASGRLSSLRFSPRNADSFPADRRRELTAQ